MIKVNILVVVVSGSCAEGLDNSYLDPECCFFSIGKTHSKSGAQCEMSRWIEGSRLDELGVRNFSQPVIRNESGPVRWVVEVTLDGSNCPPSE